MHQVSKEQDVVHVVGRKKRANGRERREASGNFVEKRRGGEKGEA